MMEKMSPGAKVSETSDLIIHDTEQDIAVELDKISPRWSLQGERTEVGVYYVLSYDVASGSEIMPCNKICKPLMVYRFTGKVMTSITTLLS